MSQLTVQVPDPILEAARKLAARERISLEELVSRMLCEAVQQDEQWEQRVTRGKQVSRERFFEILAKSPEAPPIAGDEAP